MKTDENMIDEDLLHELTAAPGPTATRPFGEIASRTAVLRRRRRAVVAAGASLVTVAAVTAAGLNLGGPAPSRSGIAQPAAQKTAKPVDCSTGKGRDLTPKEAPDLLYLPPESLTGPAVGAPMMSLDVPNCPHKSKQMWYAMANGKVSRTLGVYGPHDRDPYAANDGLDTSVDKSGPRQVDINGSRATFYYTTQDREGKMFWTTKDGRMWQADVQGMTLKQSIAAIRSVVLDGDRISTSRTPTGLSTLAPILGDSIPDYSDRDFDLQFVTTKPDLGWALSVSALAHEPFSPAVGQRPVYINGQLGWWQDDGISTWSHKRLITLVWPLPGNSQIASINGRVSQQKALAMARAMVKVSPDDPRLNQKH